MQISQIYNPQFFVINFFFFFFFCNCESRFKTKPKILNGNFNLSHYFHTYKISTCKLKEKDCVNLLFEKLFVYKKW